VSGLGGILSSLFSGSTVTALVLNLQLQGPQLLKALQTQDMYLAGAIVMVQAILVVVGILLSDIALAFLDPRIRYSGGSR
jgi:peptide/nickel transport system permease protein